MFLKIKKTRFFSFTLIELLVVIAIIAILAAFLLYNPVVDTGPDGWNSGYKILGDKWRELSPIHHLKSGMPPCLV